MESTSKTIDSVADLGRRPIGVFDSGVGGMTVAREMKKLLPAEDVVYLGDTARLPYGSKSARLVQQYSIQNTVFLCSHDVKLVVIACNTASASSQQFLQHLFRIPVLGVVEAGARIAVQTTKNNRIGVVGTKSTVAKLAYTAAIARIDPNVEVIETATPLLVHIVEEYWNEKPVTREILREYLLPLLKKDIDTLILGCTHYPLLISQFREVAPGINLVDSGSEVAVEVKSALESQGLLNRQRHSGRMAFHLTDPQPEFDRWSRLVMGQEMRARLVPPGEFGFT